MTQPAPHVLIVEDDPILGGAITQRLRLEGFDVAWTQTCAEALAEIRRRRPGFILCDIVLPDGSGESLFRDAQPYLGGTPILFATAFGEIDQAVRLVKAGADDYLTKPYAVDDLIARIRARTQPGATDPHTPGGPQPGLAAASISPSATGFALSPVTEAIAEQLRRVAASDLPVLITGETGTGKEVAARYLHAQSPRAARPFVAVNCGAIPHELLESQFFGHERGAFTGAAQAHAGYFEETGEGTLFLDEVGELDPRLQAALLRVLQDRSFRPVGARADRHFAGRVVAATNANLDQLRADRLFRDDLFFRLSVIELSLPPLRERTAEIEPLTQRLLAEIAARQGRTAPPLTPQALAALRDHAWPGNIRELRNRLERASLLAGDAPLTPDTLFPEQRLDTLPSETLADARRKAEQELIDQALSLSNGRIGEAAKRLGISRTTLWKRMKE